MFDEIMPTPTASQPVVRIALAHLARFRIQYSERGAIQHLVFRHSIQWRRIALASYEQRAAIHDTAHWKLGTAAHV